MQQADGRDPDVREQGTDLPNDRLIQLEWNARRGLFNDAVSDFEDLVTHHPQSNRNASIQNGVVVGAEPGRRHGVISGEIQEIEVATPRNTYRGPEPGAQQRERRGHQPAAGAGAESQVADAGTGDAGTG